MWLRSPSRGLASCRSGSIQALNDGISLVSPFQPFFPSCCFQMVASGSSWLQFQVWYPLRVKSSGKESFYSIRIKWSCWVTELITETREKELYHVCLMVQDVRRSVFLKNLDECISHKCGRQLLGEIHWWPWIQCVWSSFLFLHSAQ